jgi:hypothetical protein
VALVDLANIGVVSCSFSAKHAFNEDSIEPKWFLCGKGGINIYAFYGIEKDSLS